MVIEFSLASGYWIMDYGSRIMNQVYFFVVLLMIGIVTILPIFEKGD